ncbi:MAG TPA: hypothetical protein VKC60_13165 [Opitutaceae bacterium]|nr:hypothetical protein [Opitutaceae bacterium]
MNIHTYKTVGAVFLGLAAFIISARGQTIASADAYPANPSAALLGKRYVSADGYFERFRYAPLAPNTYGGVVAGNYPVFEYFDVGLSYRNDTGNSAAMKIRDNVLEATGTGYYRLKGFDQSSMFSLLNGVTPFVTAAAGYSWNKVTASGIDYNNNHPYYRVVAGVEVPVYGALSVRASAAFSDYFETFNGFHSPALRGWSYDVSANYWITSRVGVSAGAVYDMGTASTADSIVYRAGVRISF